MSESSLIVPVVVPTGSLYFATIHPDETVHHVIGALLAQPEVTSEVLGDLDDTDWALQKIRIEKSGRQWEERDLENLGDGKLLSSCFLRYTTEHQGLLTSVRFIGSQATLVSVAQLV